MSTGTTDRPSHPRGLGERLRALRLATRPRVSQTAAAKAIGASQNRISRAEAGQHVLTATEVTTLCRLYGAAAAEARQLVSAATALRESHTDARTVFQRGLSTMQDRILQVEAASRLVRSFHPTTVVGPLQTERYAAAVLHGDESAVRSRMMRGRALANEPERRWVVVQTEGALLWNVDCAEVMAEQLDHLAEASRLPNVDLRIITHRQGTAGLTQMHGFHVYDEQFVQVSVLTGTSLGGRDVTRYAERFELLAAVALTGDAARAELDRIRDVYQ